MLTDDQLAAKLTQFLAEHADQLAALGYLPSPECRLERMSDVFYKWHLGEVAPGVWPVLHLFTAPDESPAHDHPWDFTSRVLAGSYVERVYRYDPGTGEVRERDVTRRPGASFFVRAEHVHRIVALPDGDCWTVVVAAPPRRTSGVYEFRPDGPYWRAWHETEFKPLCGL